MRTFSRIYLLTAEILWAALLILLPVTSMPAVRDLLHINTIAGPSVLALGMLIILWLIPYLLKNGNLPREILPLFEFILACLLSITAAWFIFIPTFKDVGLIRPIASAFITLLVGAGYFLLTYSRIATEKDFRVALRWIYLGRRDHDHLVPHAVHHVARQWAISRTGCVTFKISFHWVRSTGNGRPVLLWNLPGWLTC